MADVKKTCALAYCLKEPLPYSKNSLCIFHEPEKTEQDCKRFGELIENKCKHKDYDFRGYVFPKKFRFKIRKFEGDVVFTKSTFEGDADFKGSTFRGFTEFYGSTFMGNAIFTKSTFQGKAEFCESIFHKDAEFSYTTFQHSTSFRATTFNANAFFSYSIFQGYASFRKATFGGASSFFLSHFKGYAYFAESTFKNEADFTGVIFENRVTAKGSKFKIKNFGEIIYRAAKLSSHKVGEYREEGDYHWLEMEAIRHGKSIFSRILIFLFQRLLHGYGEKYRNVIITAIIIILICSVFFALLGIQEQNCQNQIHNYWTCLYFSVVTFTTLGYGDFHPIGTTRAIAATEAFFGAFLMALFVVTFARRWRR